MPDPTPPHLRNHLESLEARDVPSATPWLVEAFQRGPSSGLPAGWSQWKSTPIAGFQVDGTGGLGDSGQLVSRSANPTDARAWLSAPFAANVETSAAVYLNTPAPARLLARGQNLGTSAPSYYAAQVANGGEVKLVRVVRGAEVVLGAVKSDDAVTNRWVTVTLRAEGDSLRAFLYRGDSNQYLDPAGHWVRRPTAAISVADKALKGAGQVGFARAGRTAGTITLDSLRVAPADDRPLPLAEERFGRGAQAGLPPGWKEWNGPGPVSVRTAADETLRVEAGSTTPVRAWLGKALPADAQVSSSIYIDSRVGAGLFARGSHLDGTRPTYYGIEVKRGLELDLVKVVNGTRTVIASTTTTGWQSGIWVQASLVLNGDQLRVQLYRSDTGQYLSGSGAWTLASAWAMTARDSSIQAGGLAGLSRGTGHAGTLVFDNFIVTTSPDRYAAPGSIPTEADKPTAPTTPGPDLPAVPVPVPVPPVTPPASPPPVALPPVSQPGPVAGLPTVKRHYDHIRLANLAYYGTPMGSFEQGLLRNSVDLVIPNLTYLDAIGKASPSTPQLVYTNVSNIYLGLITDWNEYADRNRLDREAAFYHATSPQKFAGMSASSVPVNRFWAVYRGSDSAGYENLTRDSRNTGSAFAFGTTNQSVAFGYIEKYRELNIDLKSSAPGFSANYEYVSAVDSQGRPTRWSDLPLLGDGTNNLTRDGKVVFDPPRDWAAARIEGSARLFYVRAKTLRGSPPTANSVLGADYSAGNITPAFDIKADRDGDGYLNDSEYARRRHGMDARFEYQSRITYPNYGPMRFATNVGDPGLRAWAADYHTRFLAATPLADGFFVDNSIGRLAVNPDGVRESLDGYSADYGSLLGSINKSLSKSGKWLLANTAGGNVTAEPILRNGVSYLEEYALRPLSANHVQFDDLMATLSYRRELSGRRAYEVLDSLPTQDIDANDPRVQLSTLAMYYTVADPQLSFLMMNGGNEPASGWARHWTDAVKFDVGAPRGAAREFAAGADPANRGLAYKVYARDYSGALVLYKPLSYTRGVAGGIGANTATTHQLGGNYRLVRADGTLGPVVRSVNLRNGEGAVLARA